MRTSGRKSRQSSGTRCLSPVPTSTVYTHGPACIIVIVPEFQGSIEEVAKEKCRLAASQLGTAVITEDTALCFDAMGELPGPYIKWFLQGLGHDGLNRMLSGWEDKGARAVCTFAYSAGPESDPILFQGITHVSNHYISVVSERLEG